MLGFFFDLLSIQRCSKLSSEAEAFERSQGLNQDVILHDECTKFSELAGLELLTVDANRSSDFALFADV